ncbi:hypothetical protein ACQ4LE_000949 [Meloidogyne hapla]
MVLLTEECARILNCPLKSLRDQLFHPKNRILILKELLGRKVRTTYEDRNGRQKTFKIGGLTKYGANSTQAYGRLPRPFNISVAAHFYARHRIRLQRPFLHCIVERFPRHMEDRYYPLELLELIVEEEEEQNDERSTPSTLKQPLIFKCGSSSEEDGEELSMCELSLGW